MNYMTVGFLEIILDILVTISRGLVDSIRGSFVLFYLDKSIKEESSKKYLQKGSDTRTRHSSSPKTYRTDEEPKILKRTLQCCALNGGVFWASLLLFDIGLLPCLKKLVNLAMGDASSSGHVWLWIKMFLSWTFGAIWVVPLLFLCKIVNNLWFLDIAGVAYRHYCQTNKGVYMSRSVSYALADTVLSVVIQVLFLVQSVFVCLLPSPFGQMIWLIHMCMLYSLYSFEYKWANMGWELHQRLTYIENHWPYFIGFGLPLALVTSLPSSYIVSGCIFSILFPLFIVSGNEAKLKREVPNYFPLQLFRPVVAVSNAILLRCIRHHGHS